MCGVDDLADHTGIGDPGDEPVLLGIIFIVVLDKESLSLFVISLSL